MEDQKKFWEGMENFYYRMEENARMEDKKKRLPFQSILSPASRYAL